MLEPLNLGLAMIAGFLSTLQPCVLPLIPIIFGGAILQNKYAPIYIGLGMVVFYTLLGALTGFIEPLFGFEPSQFQTIGAVMMVGSGIMLLSPQLLSKFSILFSSFLNLLNRRAGSLSFESPISCLLLGAILSLMWTPCAGPMLASTLTILTSGLMADGDTNTQTVLQGSVLLGVYGIGTAIPLVTLSYITRSAFSSWSKGLIKAQELLTKILGIFFVMIGVLILTGAMKMIEIYLLTILPESWLGFVNSI
jgi:cytochrome c biogenesis protein CcdA